jgi:hypothetical protein
LEGRILSDEVLDLRRPACATTDLGSSYCGMYIVPRNYQDHINLVEQNYCTANVVWSSHVVQALQCCALNGLSTLRARSSPTKDHLSDNGKAQYS